MTSRTSASATFLLLATGAALAQGPPAATIDTEPVLRVSAQGPTAFVTSLAFGPDGRTLYAAGFDKVVHVWAADAAGKFRPASAAYRVPIGPGINGALNGLAVSSDGAWVAVAGVGLARGLAGFRQSGLWVPSLTALTNEMREDQGVIHVFNTKTGEVRVLRGHRGTVMTLTFAPTRAGKPTLLASVAQENVGGRFEGAVRVWDVEGGVEVAHLPGLPNLISPDGRLRAPRLALWHAAAGGAQGPRLALAWDDGLFRVWDVRTGAKPQATADADFNHTIAYAARTDQAVTGSVQEGRGRLQTWRLPENEGPEAVRAALLPPGYRPRVLALVPGAAGQIAVVAEVPEGPGKSEYRLGLYTTDSLRPVAEPVKLWSGERIQTALAAAPDGRFVAVAGNSAHEVHVFAVADLLRGVDARQRLRGIGTAFPAGSFVRKGENRGVVLAESTRDPQAGDLLFDLRGRSLTTDPAGWLPDVARPDGWGLKVIGPTKDRPVWTLEVQKDDAVHVTIRLKPNQILTAFALLPPQDGRGEPVVAAAYRFFGQPLLGLFDAKTGEAFRFLTGHLNPVRSLAFSGDGRLLLSTADDQTACVWALGGGDQAAGALGFLSGLLVNEKGGAVVVAELDQKSLTAENRQALQAAGVRVGDTVEGLVEGGRLRPFAASRDFYQQFARVAPGKEVTLRVRGRGDVSLVVGRGTDEGKPLFTLFVTRPAHDGGPRHWIGWSPVGPYDCSDREAERLLGWHKNTGDARQPTSFAPANAYRDQYFRPDILRYLVELGNTGRALEAWKKDHPDKPREPKMTLWFRELGPEPDVDARGRVLATRRPQSLQLTLHEPPAGKVRGVTWQVNGGARGEFTLAADRDWEADLGRLAWKRGEHKVRVTLRAEDTQVHEFVRELALSYQPPPPIVKLLDTLPHAVNTPAYRVRAEVTPAEGEPAAVEVVHRLNGKTVPGAKAREAKVVTRIDETFTLGPGDNQIQVTARNQGAAPGDAGESDTETIEVVYKSPKPQIALTEVVPLPDGPALRPDPAKPDAPIVVETPVVRVVGAIEALETLSEAGWSMGGKQAALGSGKEKKLPINQEVRLAAPGKPTIIRFAARAANSEQTERSLTLLYQPRLPELRLTAPAEGQPLYEGRDQPLVRLEGRLRWPEDRQQGTAQVLLNEKEVGSPLDLNTKGEDFSATATLQPGENALQVRLRNPWGREVVTPKLLVTYRRPPRLLEVTGPGKVAKPLAEVVAVVETDRRLPPTRVLVDNREVDAKELRPVEAAAKGDRVRWRLTARDVPLQKGKNRIEVRVANADDWSLEPGFVDVEFVEPPKPPPPKAEAAVLNPRQDGVVEEPTYRVEFQVRSKSPLTRVELQRGGKTVFAGLDQLKKNEAGEYELNVTSAVPLEEGANSVKVVAVNAGGEQVSRPVVLTYQPQPVRVLIDHLQVGDQTVRPLAAAPDGLLTFPSVPTGRVALAGRVTWGRDDDKLKTMNQVQVYVNGSLQPPVALGPRSGSSRERPFLAPVVLDRAEGNQLTVRLPDAAEEAGSHTKCKVDCTSPARAAEVRRQLHVLIVNNGKEEGSRVKQTVLAALGARPTGPDRFKRDGFADGGRVYGPLLGADVIQERVNGLLLTMRNNLQLRAAQGAVHDVALVYFRTGETINDRGHFFHTSDTASDPKLIWSGIPCDRLARQFASNLGSQLVLFDVTREPDRAYPSSRDKVAQWNDDPNVAVWRYAWTGKPQAQGADARLIEDFRDAMAGSKNLRDVAARVEQKFTSPSNLPPYSKAYEDRLRVSKVHKDRLLFDQQVPNDLGEMPLPPPQR